MSRTQPHTLQRQPVVEVLLVFCALRVLRQPCKNGNAVRRRHECDVQLLKGLRKEPIGRGEAFGIQSDECGELRPGEEV